MEEHDSGPLVAVDVGNSSIDLAIFSHWNRATSPLPVPVYRAKFPTVGTDPVPLAEFLTHVPSQAPWYIASVHRSGLNRFLRSVPLPLGGRGVHLLQTEDFRVEVGVREPLRLGLDRRAAAVAANRVRRTDQPLIFIDCGTAATINLVDHQGCFRGGAILPGIGLAVQSLASGTDALPLLKELIASPPEVIGRDTLSAIQSGVYWGVIGAIHEIVARIERKAGEPIDTLLTGGGADTIVSELRFPVRHYPDLVLSGIALSGYLRENSNPMRTIDT